jgi:hypothetical protein
MGGMVEAIIANVIRAEFPNIDESLHNPGNWGQRTAYQAGSMLISGFLAHEMGLDPAVAGSAAYNAAANNFLTGKQYEEKMRRLANAKSEAERQKIQAYYAVLDRQQFEDMKIYAANAEYKVPWEASFQEQIDFNLPHADSDGYRVYEPTGITHELNEYGRPLRPMDTFENSHAIVDEKNAYQLGVMYTLRDELQTLVNQFPDQQLDVEKLRWMAEEAQILNIFKGSTSLDPDWLVASATIKAGGMLLLPVSGATQVSWGLIGGLQRSGVG